MTARVRILGGTDIAATLPRIFDRQRACPRHFNESAPARLTPKLNPLMKTARSTADISRASMGRIAMATYITQDCINCGACEPECPNEAISEGDDIYVIDPELCTECVGFNDHEACQAVCPVECCLPDPKRTEAEALLLERAIKLHPDDSELKTKADANDFPSRFRK